MPKIFIVACEASGDLHASHLAMELRALRPDVKFQGIGGPLMANAGIEVLEDMTKISALGLGDVLRQYFTYLKIFNETLAAIEKFQPDVIVLLDSPAFNLRLAKKISKMKRRESSEGDKKKFPVVYYISPQLWAWGGNRIHTVKKTISKMLVILPFEKEIYDKAGVPVSFVGHPLLDEISESADKKELRARFEIHEGETAIGLLPGSRKREIERIFPAMMASAVLIKEKIKKPVFFLVKSPNVPEDFYQNVLRQYPHIFVRQLKNHDGLFRDVVAAVDFALITSGTATLEAGIIGTPYILLYKTSLSTYLIGRPLVRIPFLGLVNLLAKKQVVPEFIQFLDPEKIAQTAVSILNNPEAYQGMQRDFEAVRKKLGESGASRKAAEEILKSLPQTAEI